MTQPRIDILLATYNGERYVGALLDSLLAQTYKNIRILVRDDGSTDGTLRVIESYEKQHPEKIEFLRHTENLGCNGNFSKLLEHAPSDYMMFSDQDDIWLPGKVEAAFEKLQALERSHSKETPLLVHGDLKVVDGDLKEISPSFWEYSKLYPKTTSTLNRLLVQNVVTGCTVLINRPLAQLALPIPSDCLQHDWWLALVAAGLGEIGIVEEPHILYRQHGGNSVGARPCSASHYVKKKFTTPRSADIEYKRRNLQQALLYRERYHEHLSLKNQSLVAAYCAAYQGSYVKRIYLMFKHGFFKNGFMRNLVGIIPRRLF